MALEKDDLLSPIMEKARNKILVQYSDSTFDEALDGVKSSLKTENDMPSRLALLAAKSWIIRNKVHVLMNEPFTYSLSEMEGTNIFSEYEDEDEDEDTVDGLFDDDDDEDGNGDNSGKVKIVIIKATTLNGDKLLKDAAMEVGKDDAEKLISEKKAKYAPDA